MKIIIAGTEFGFPNGLAATARVMQYARGFLENGASVKVLCLVPTEKGKIPAMNIHASGNYKGIDFEYISGSTSRAKSFMKRRWLTLTAPWQYFNAVQIENKKQRIDALILFSNSPSIMLLTFLITRVLGIRYFQEKSELPFAYDRKTFFLRIYAWFFVHTLYRLQDGIIVISAYLENYFAPLKRNNTRLIRIPILVNSQQFDRPPNLLQPKCRYVAYTGDLDYSKGVDYLIRSFHLLVSSFPDVNLLISGMASSAERLIKLQELAADLSVGKRCQFLGFISTEDWQKLLWNAAVLVIPHPSGEFSMAAFPTKLAEYLASGAPVVSTRIGEIDHYLTDGVDAYLVPPNDEIALAEKIRYVLEHPDESRKVGLQGRRVASTYFDFHSQTKRLLRDIS